LSSHVKKYAKELYVMKYLKIYFIIHNCCVATHEVRVYSLI